MEEADTRGVDVARASGIEAQMAANIAGVNEKGLSSVKS
jgi:hypothetical protein